MGSLSVKDKRTGDLSPDFSIGTSISNYFMDRSDLDLNRIEQFVSGTDPGKDDEYIESVFCDSEKEHSLKKLLSGQFKEILNSKQEPDVNIDHILYKIHYDINTREAEKRGRRTTEIMKWVMRIAGILVLPLMVIWGVSGYFTTKARQQAWVEIKAPAWTRAQFTLPDGTTGWLNSKSSIRYNLDFVNDRNVILDGEAFFDVFHDARKPFRVMTDDVVLKVLGTRFNIASYDDEPKVEVVLEEGSLIFNDLDMNKTYSMKPNDLVTYDKANRNFTTEVVQPQKYLSWKEGKLVFRNDPLDVICRRLERWYNVDVEVNIGSVDNLRLRATFVDENLEQVLDLLRRSLPIDYTVQDGRLNSDNTYSKKKVIILPHKN